MNARAKTEAKPVDLRMLLNRALRAQGYWKLCKAQGSDYSVVSNKLSRFLVIAILVGSAVSVNRIFDLSLWHSIEIVLGAIVAWVVVVLITGAPAGIFAYISLFLWLIGAGGYLAITHEFSVLVFTHLLPFGVVLAAQWTGGAMKLAGHVPFFVQLALIIVLLPLLSEDPWRLAAEAGGRRIAMLAALSIIPLCYVLVLRIVKTDTETTFAQAAARIEAEPTRYSADATQFLLKKMREAGEVELADDRVQGEIETAYGRMSTYIGEVITLGRRAFRLRAIRRLLAMVIGISLAVWLLIYILAWAAMPPSLAEQWSKRDVGYWTPPPLGFDLHFPLGPYLLVAALLATVACVGFLGFALTEDQYSEALWGAVIHRTATDCVKLAIPYLHLSDVAELDGGEQDPHSVKSRQPTSTSANHISKE
jgi:hypothetical protein